MNKEVNKFPKKGEIWLINYNYKPNSDHQIQELETESLIKKIRPSLIVSNDIQNEFDREIIVVPLTSKELDKIRSYEILIKKDQVNGLEKDSKILFNRLRNVEKVTRLREYVGIVSEEVIQKAKEKLKLVLDLE
jgi:mRNA interferase MazF